uniref:Actin maturation protease n=1 Tax=Callorhinchus milii TaxID=7868 RepID=A0A4W3KEZ8_CALMI
TFSVNQSALLPPTPFQPRVTSLIPPPPPPLPSSPSVHPKKKLYQALAQGREAVVGDREEVKMILQNRQISSRKGLKWLLINKFIPSLIQDGPQCGLVALRMAGHLLDPHRAVSLDEMVSLAVARGYTVQGEMFSAIDMKSLAEELYPCQGHLLTEGLAGSNRTIIINHLVNGYPVLLPYDEDFNHEPCQRGGHRAHWAAVSGGTSLPFPGKLHPTDPPSQAGYPGDSVIETHLLAKQGKSLRYQMWEYQRVLESNAQLREFDPKRATDGTAYVVPKGGVQSGLCGNVLLLVPLSLPHPPLRT